MRLNENEKALFDFVKETHGLTLPDHVFQCRRALDALDDQERAALWSFSITGLGGVLKWLDEGVPEIDGQECGSYRYFGDAPEFLMVLRGDSDGLHYGLWYDDPAKPPPFLTYFYNKDDPTHRFAGTTLGEVFVEMLENKDEDDYEGEELEELTVARSAAAKLAAACTPVATELPEFGDKRRLGTSNARLWAPGSKPKVYAAGLSEGGPERWGKAAEEALALAEKGKAADALALGHDLMLGGGKKAQDEAAKRLLEAAYAALGRGGLTKIAHQHIDARAELLKSRRKYR